MKTKMAGAFTLQDMVNQTIQRTREKVAAAEGGDDKAKKPPPFMKKKDDDKEEPKEQEKKSSTGDFDFNDPEHISKLASALLHTGEQMVKEADKVENGGESRQGGMQLPNNSPVGGKQPYKKDAATAAHQSAKDQGKTSTHPDGAGGKGTLNGDNMGMGVLPAMPKKGVLKVGSAGESVKDLIERKKAEMQGGEPAAEPAAHEKQAAAEGDEAVDFILSKTAWGEVEHRMGGETLDSASGEGPKPPTGGSNSARSMIESNKAAIDYKKREAKAPVKKQLAEVLTEPALSAAHDSKVNENLRNASKGGVKIAAAKALLQKIAEEGCTCSGKGECRYCKLKEAKKSMDKKSSAVAAEGEQSAQA